MTVPTNPPPATETEEQLIERARSCVSQCRWTIGECASVWTSRHARGRGDADFGQLVGELSGDQVQQRRRVWEKFGANRSQYPSLHWSHFYAALNWSDASDTLTWAEQQRATVAEMVLLHKTWWGGLTAGDLPEVEHSPTGLASPEQVDREEPQYADTYERSMSAAVTMDDVVGTAERAELEPYAPYASGATTRPNQQTEDHTILTRLVQRLEMCDRALDKSLQRSLAEAPRDLRRRLMDAVESLAAKVLEG